VIPLRYQLSADYWLFASGNWLDIREELLYNSINKIKQKAAGVLN
jgi:hypothetical protein